jgi:hypothetical protein
VEGSLAAIRTFTEHFVRDVGDRPRGFLGWKPAGAVCESHSFYARHVGRADE